MSTTNVIVELLVIGFVALMWLGVIVAKWLGIDPSQVNAIATNYKDWSALLTLFITAIAYQVGWLVNGLSYAVTQVIAGHWVREWLFKKEGVDYKESRTRFYQKASEELMKDLAVDRSVVRLSRAGILNFAALAYVAESTTSPLTAIRIFFLVCAGLCFLLWIHRYVRYYNQIIEANKVV